MMSTLRPNFDFFAFLRVPLKKESNTKKAIKARKVIDAPIAMKVSKAKTVLRLPSVTKVTKISAVIEKPRSGKSSDLESDTSVIAKNPCENIRKGKETNKIKAKSVLQKAIGKAASKLVQNSRTKAMGKAASKSIQKSMSKGTGKAASKLIQKSRSLLKEKIMINKTKRKAKEIRNGKVETHNPKVAPPSQLVPIRSSATRVQTPSSGTTMKSREEETCSGHRQKKLMALKLTALEKLYKKHKKGSLGTEPINDTLAQTKEELISKQLPQLKDMCSEQNLLVSGTKRVLIKRLIGQDQEMLKTKMVRAILIFEGINRSKVRKQEAKECADARRHKDKVYNATKKLKDDVVAQTDNKLKNVLRNYGLKVSGTKDEKVERVFARQQEEGEVDRILSERAAHARKQELLSMSPRSLMAECQQADDVLQDNLLKHIMLDRLLLVETKKRAITCI